MKQKEERACVIPLCHQGHFSALEMTALGAGAGFGKEGGGVVLKQLNERKGRRMHTWSTVQLTDSHHCSFTICKSTYMQNFPCKYVI